uniref:Uncharacterized protein n=1 Tax=Panagrolaimus sp. PS1159 TaxID=55785 RepID=A0AC35F115_9BILA
MKLLTFLGLSLILHLCLAEFGSRKIPPFRPEKDEKADEVFDREKRGVLDKIPPIVPEEDEKMNGVVAGHMDKREPQKDDQQNGINLPLLLKTHRLRPGSGDDIKRIIDDYINSHKNGNVKPEDESVDEPRLLGEPLIGKNRHPKKEHEIQKREVENDNSDDIKLPGKNMIGENRHPKGEKKEHVIQKREAEVENGNDDLPLLLKSHRLRPGSGDGINDIIQKYIESHKNEKDGNVGEPELPGKNMIGKNRHPEGEKKDSEAEAQNSNDDLPLLLKSHRLRPGSGDDYKKIVDEYVNSKKGEQENEGVGEPELPGKNMIGKNRHPDNNEPSSNDSPVEQDVDDDDTDIRPLGMGLIGKFRRPPVFPVGKDRIVRGNENKTPWKIECKEEDRQQVLRCFRGYFKNFDLIVGEKLPTMREIYQKFKDVKDYEKHQKYFKEFSGCFKSTPETCFHADELSKISQQPEEADYLATFFSLSEFSFKSKHNKKIAKCFIKQIEKCATHSGTNFKECDSAKQLLNEAIEKFNVNCAKFEPQPDDLKTLLKPFVKRTTLGDNCPNLLSDINV